MNYTLHHGDNREVLRTMSSDSVDSIVCDPPYELGFMGKRWDSTGIAYDVTLWAECLRVLKPGGHLLAFGGSRTYHRLAVAIEDAGFEIRDCIMWLYASGFPKSLDVSKAIDKQNGDSQLERRLRFTAWVRSTGLTSSQIDKATGTNMGGHYTTQASQPAIMTRQHLDAVRHLIGDVPDWVEAEVDIRTTESEAWKAREVVGVPGYPSGLHRGKIADYSPKNADDYQPVITAPHLPTAQQWQGWGTALKPAHEPIVVARKPLQGTVADNVLTWGVGALNIDGCRVGDNTGRWPANVIFDEEAAQMLDAQSGGASRFFYIPKASRAEREAGLDGMEVRQMDESRQEGNPGGDNPRNRGVQKRANHHPTVKPIALMRYLVRMVTPRGGVVLDPFMGSGSTGCAAMLEGMNFIGIDITPEYKEIAERRIQYWASQNPMGLSS